MNGAGATIPPALLQRKATHFVLWRPRYAPLGLFIGNFRQPSAAPYGNFREFPLVASPLARNDPPDLWEIAAEDCGLVDGEVYFYWFKVRNANAYDPVARVFYCTDPTAWTVDRRYVAPVPAETDGAASCQPAGVVRYHAGQLVPCDPGGEMVDWAGDAALATLPPNNRMVIYELPTRWARSGADEGQTVGLGTFRDVLAQIEEEPGAPGFPEIAVLGPGETYLRDLGINALELLPPADSGDELGWGYGTANFFAANFYLGRPAGQDAPTATTDLAALILACHCHGIRFFVDAVMAFSRNDPYRSINFLDFHVQHGSGDPEEGGREGFGGDLFKYNYQDATPGFDPLSGQQIALYPARTHMLTYLAHWMRFYRVDGLRIDSVNNIHRPEFVRAWKEYARALWHDRGGSDDRFLVVGEELSEPPSLITDGCLGALWNERFKHLARHVITGRNADGIADFEGSVRAMVDCRLLRDANGTPIFTDGAQAVNYLTSHDTAGCENQRLFNDLDDLGVADKERRVKLAFVCLLTAVGIPMILAGEEFADPQDVNVNGPGIGPLNKQTDPVDYQLLNDDWRQRIFTYVSRLVHFRTASPSLAMNDTAFIHADFTEGKRVVAWQRGQGADCVVVVANFSDYGTPNATPENPAAEYRVLNWPATPPGKQWREITQARDVPAEWVGREPIFPWEAKVYALT